MRGRSGTKQGDNLGKKTNKKTLEGDNIQTDMATTRLGQVSEIIIKFKIQKIN